MTAPALQELNESIYDQLTFVRRRPALFLGEPSIFRLRAFLDGYMAGLGRVGFTLRDVVEFHDFHDWTARRLGFSSSTSGWANMIRDRSAGEREALDRFFALLDEFRAERYERKG